MSFLSKLNSLQYIPLSLFDLQGWIDYPAIYVWDCNSAETIVQAFSRYVNENDRSQKVIFVY